MQGGPSEASPTGRLREMAGLAVLGSPYTSSNARCSPTHQSYPTCQPRTRQSTERKMISDNGLRRCPAHAPRGANSRGGAKPARAARPQELRCHGWNTDLVRLPSAAVRGRLPGFRVFCVFRGFRPAGPPAIRRTPEYTHGHETYSWVHPMSSYVHPMSILCPSWVRPGCILGASFAAKPQENARIVYV